jgi:MFS family permease
MAAVDGRRQALVLVVASVARLHVGGLGLAVLLLAEDRRGSLADGGLAVALLSIGVALARIGQGRLVDRVGVATLPAIALAHAVSAALVLAAPGAALAPAVLVLGLTAPAITVVTRWLWARDVGVRRQPWVFGLDTALQDGAFVIGPLLAGVVAETAGPRAAVAVLVALGCAGGAGLVLVVPAVPRAAARSAREGLRSVVGVLVAIGGLGVIYGALGVGAVAVALDAGRDGAAGVVTAALFAGGIVGDLALAPRRPDVPVARRLRARVPVLLLATALVPFAPGVAGVTVAVALTGAVLANASVTLLLDLAARASPQVRAEGFGWSGATLRLGNAAGAGSAGLLAEWVDARAALAVALAGAALTTAVVLRRQPG